MVLDKGRIVEFDSPNSLLENKNGKFYSSLNYLKINVTC